MKSATLAIFSIAIAAVSAKFYDEFHPAEKEGVAQDYQSYQCPRPCPPPPPPKPTCSSPFIGCDCPNGFGLVVDYNNATVPQVYCQQMCFRQSNITSSGSGVLPAPNLLQCLGDVKVDRPNCLAAPYIVDASACSGCGNVQVFFNGLSICVAKVDPSWDQFSPACINGYTNQPVIVEDSTPGLNQCEDLSSAQLTTLTTPTCSPCASLCTQPQQQWDNQYQWGNQCQWSGRYY